MPQEDQSALFKLRKTLDEQKIMLCFNGSLNRGIIEEIGIALRRHLEADLVTKSAVTDVFSVYIEQTQNIRNYAQNEAQDEREATRLNSAIIVISKEENGYAVSSANLIRTEHYDKLAARIEQLRNMDAAELKQHYKTVLRLPRDDAASAGLGLISMARAADRPMSYDFQKQENGYGLFGLKVTIAGGKV